MPSPPERPVEPYRPSPTTVLLWILGFVVAHVALDRLLDLAPGDTTGLPGARLLEIFIFWVPVLFLAILVGLGTGKRTRWQIRLAVLLAYASVVAVLGVTATSPPAGAPSCNLDAGQAHCVANSWFDLLFRLAPIPAFFFLFANGRHKWTVGQCLGLALATFTTWRGIYSNFPSLLVIAGGGTTSGPVPAILFYQNFFLKALWEVAYIILGLLFIFQRVPGIHKPFRWGQEIERSLRPLGAWTRRDVRTDLAWGAVVFVPIAIGASAMGWLLSQGPTGQVGDDSRVYNEITIDLVFLLSIAAGVGEELVFRGFLQGAFERVMLFRGWPRPAWAILATGVVGAVGIGTYMVLFVDVTDGVLAGLGIGIFAGVVAMVLGWGGFGTAILLQALLFGMAHASYGDLDHIILPLLFGLLAGIVYRLFGLFAIILVHVEIDVFAFASSYQGVGNAQLNVALTLLFLAQFAFAIIFLVFKLITWYEGRRRLLAILIRS